jgi:hypothetical protein
MICRPSGPSPTFGYNSFHFLLAAVLCEYISGEPKADDDVSEAAWVPVDDILLGKLRCSEHVDDVIRLATGCPP